MAGCAGDVAGGLRERGARRRGSRPRSSLRRCAQRTANRRWKACLRDGQIPGDKQQIFDDYFTKYALPQFVLHANGSNLRAIRENFHKKFFLAAPGPARQRLLELTVEGFNKILFDPRIWERVLRGRRRQMDGMDRRQDQRHLRPGRIERDRKARPAPVPSRCRRRCRSCWRLPNRQAKATPGEETMPCARRLCVRLEHHAENPAASAETRTQAPRHDAGDRRISAKPPAGHDAAVNDYLRGRAAEVLALMRKKSARRTRSSRALDRIIGNPAEVGHAALRRRPGPWAAWSFRPDRTSISNRWPTTSVTWWSTPAESELDQAEGSESLDFDVAATPESVGSRRARRNVSRKGPQRPGGWRRRSGASGFRRKSHQETQETR